MKPGAPGGYGTACSVEFFLAILAFELDFAGEPKKPDAFFLREFLPARLVELLLRLAAAFDFDLFGVAGGDARVDAGSSCGLVLRCKASISSGVKLTFVLPFSRARAMRSNADWIRGSPLPRPAF